MVCPFSERQSPGDPAVRCPAKSFGSPGGSTVKPRTLPPLLGLFAFIALCADAHAAVPTDNPVAAHYAAPEGYPAWTDGVRWANVVDMSRYANGKTDFEKFEA